MPTVTDIDDFRPCTILTAPNGDAHIIPLVVFQRIANGTLSVDDIDNRDQVLRAVIKDWLETLE
ncbi:hypothetical protein NPJ88_000430 [Halomonas elongata]|uniref:hypothetical protein n=1 Tax=Halomonas elongata TaxID=2746 RepID=UPI00255AFF2D|nr:hypothetical protein [Halomonas elongata]MDL4860789.1 hypothetical protein [Halomonas elongata]